MQSLRRTGGKFHARRTFLRATFNVWLTVASANDDPLFALVKLITMP